MALRSVAKCADWEKGSSFLYNLSAHLSSGVTSLCVVYRLGDPPQAWLLAIGLLTMPRSLMITPPFIRYEAKKIYTAIGFETSIVDKPNLQPPVVTKIIGNVFGERVNNRVQWVILKLDSEDHLAFPIGVPLFFIENMKYRIMKILRLLFDLSQFNSNYGPVTTAEDKIRAFTAPDHGTPVKLLSRHGLVRLKEIE